MATRRYDVAGPIFLRPYPSLAGPVAAARRIAAGLSPVVLLYALYTLVRWALTDRGPALGPGHAARLLRWENALGLGWERPVQAFGLRHGWLVRAANWYYVAGFLPVLVLAAALAAWRAPVAFATLRRVFAVSLVFALVGFAAFPVAPPRLLPANRGFVDTLLAYGPRYYGDAHGSGVFNAGGRLPSLVNVYAAMPSMHVAWSALAGALLAAAIGRRWARSLAVVHPTAMAFAVVVTGNHYVLDVIGGLIVLGLAVAVTTATRRVGAPALPVLRRTAGGGVSRRRVPTSPIP
jgi:membrane-associated phospholipid phosphatase